MLRLACCLATERGIRVCAPVHDALLIEAEIPQIESAVAETAEAMWEASEIVLDGFSLRSDEQIVRYPDRYTDPRGERFWDKLMNLLEEFGGADVSHHRTPGWDTHVPLPVPSFLLCLPPLALKPVGKRAKEGKGKST